MNLATDMDLADEFGIDIEEFHRLRRYHRWPAVKLGRNVYRFTESQVELIVEQMTVEHDKPQRKSRAKATGQTKRSAARSAS